MNYKLEIEKIYALSPMQEGMLFHSLLNPNSHAYFVQTVYRIGKYIDKDILEQSFRLLLKRYESLRTVFIHEKIKKTRQVVVKDPDIYMQFEDISDLRVERQEQFLQEFKIRDRNRGFSLSTEPPIRISLLKQNRNTFILIWSYHHILMDGWCLRIILEDFFQIYRLLRQKEPVHLEPVSQYKNYIDWLETQDKEEGLRYWRNYLDGYENRTELYAGNSVGKNDAYNLAEYIFEMEDSLSEGLQKIARDHRVTLNSVLQTLWGVLLQVYNRSDDVVFGSVVSGRSGEIEGIENIVGLFINTIPVRIRGGEGRRTSEFIQSLHHFSIQSKKYEYFPLAEIQSHSPIKGSLFDHILIFENYPFHGGFKELVNSKRRELKLNCLGIFDQTSYDFNLIIFPMHPIRFKLSYNAIRYSRDLISRVAAHLKKTVAQVVQNVEIPVEQIEVIPDDEKRRILYEWNDSDTVSPVDKLIHQLFERRVETSPERIALTVVTHDSDSAVAFSRANTTYGELNRQANRLACILIEKGINAGSTVGLMVNRSLEMITGILAILKAGGTYVPIDPDYPERRIIAMMENSDISVLLSQFPIVENKSLGSAISRHEILLLDRLGKEIEGEDRGNAPPRCSPDDLIYIIFTSGSTGEPKGAGVYHRGFMNLMHWFVIQFRLLADDSNLLITSLSFDLTQKNLYASLITGGVLNIPDFGYFDPRIVATCIQANRITWINCTPTMFYKLIEYEDSVSDRQLTGLRYAFLGGEPISMRSIIGWLETDGCHIEIVNTYGPTECTDICAFYRIKEPADFRDKSVPLGKPVFNARLYIVDRHNRLMPVGITGELVVGGAGVGIGYIRDKELTAQKIFNHAFITGKAPTLLYRTGDLARFLPDGNIEFVGRSDHQVKLRGFRIELGEIESRLREHQDIKEAVVDIKGEQSLCAYFVPHRDLSCTELREYLSEVLPAYMVPSYFVGLVKLPLTPNGKIDRRHLPEPDDDQRIDQEKYIPPRNQMEEDLMGVWQGVLGRERIGVNDNFFMIGGDSIKAIQIVSRMNKEGYRLEVRDLFEHQTISQLAPYIKRLDQTADQSAVCGEFPLTPIQHYFFEAHSVDLHHYNQTVMFHSKEKLEEDLVKTIFSRIQAHHDALRITFKRSETKIIQVNHGLEYPLSLEVCNFYGRPDASTALVSKVNDIQAGIDLENGPLMKLGLFHLDDGHRLLIVIHHLVMDGISWRILLEDIETLYQQSQRGEPFELPLKSDSFKMWSEKLSRYADSGGRALKREMQYWLRLTAVPVPSIKSDFPGEGNFRKFFHTLSFFLEGEDTDRLLNKVHEAFGTEINDILLTALGLGIKRTFGNSRCLVALEGHGREPFLPGMDVSRTIGWFTSLYPVLLDASFEDDLSRQIKENKESLHQVPGKGLGFGILKYLGGDELKTKIVFNQAPQIRFNYLGQFDVDLEQMSSFGIARESSGESGSREGEIPYDFDITGMVRNNRLLLSVAYNKTRFRQETIEVFLRDFRSALKGLIEHCAGMSRRSLTPSDLTFRELSIETLEKLERQFSYTIEDIYTLSPMQEGMLFHALYDENSSAYFEQISFRLRGELDIRLAERGLNELFKRHDILRTVFLHEGLDRPVQVVMRQRQVNFVYHDIRRRTDHQLQEEFLDRFREQDRRHRFDLTRDVLMRISVIRWGNQGYEFIWSHHHILMDRWCVGVLIAEFLEIYDSLKHQRPHRLSSVTPYRFYIRWLRSRDRDESRTFWLNYLAGYDKPAGLPRLNRLKGQKRGYLNERVALALDQMESRRLEQYARSHQVTLNTLVQTIWGVVLAKYCGRYDVVFGGVVSGRPAEIEGVESMVGLFINTVPVRIRFTEQTRFRDLVIRVQEKAIGAEPHHYYPLADIQAECGAGQNLLNHIVAYQNIGIVEQVKEVETVKEDGGDGGGGSAFRLLNFDSFEHSNYDLSVVFTPGKELSVTLNYNALVFDRGLLQRVLDHFRGVAGQILNREELYIHEISFLQEEEKVRMLRMMRNEKGNSRSRNSIKDRQESHRLAADFNFFD